MAADRRTLTVVAVCAVLVIGLGLLSALRLADWGPLASPSKGLTSGVVGFVVAYDRDSDYPSLISLPISGGVGESRPLGYSPNVAWTPDGLFVADLGMDAPYQSEGGGELRLFPEIGGAPTWTVASAPPPTRTDGRIARHSAAWSGTTWYQVSLLAPEGFYVDSLQEISSTGRYLAGIPLPPCGVGVLLALPQRRVLLVCPGSNTGRVLVSGLVDHEFPIVGTDVGSIAVISSDRIWTANSGGNLTLQDFAGTPLAERDLPDRAIPRGIFASSGEFVAVPTGTEGEALEGRFSTVLILNGAGVTVADFPLQINGRSLGMTRDSILVGSDDDCVRSYSWSGVLGQTWCGIRDSVQFVTPLPPG